MPNIKKLTWQEAVSYLTEFNKQHDIKTKGLGSAECVMVAVITEDTFTKPYSLEARSYRFTNHNKHFILDNLGSSIFANSLDGSDVGVRLDYYIPTDWKVDYCYIEKETS